MKLALKRAKMGRAEAEFQVQVAAIESWWAGKGLCSLQLLEGGETKAGEGQSSATEIDRNARDAERTEHKRSNK